MANRTNRKPVFHCHKCRKAMKRRSWVQYGDMALCKECSGIYTFNPAGTIMRRERKPVTRNN